MLPRLVIYRTSTLNIDRGIISLPQGIRAHLTQTLPACDPHAKYYKMFQKVVNNLLKYDTRNTPPPPPPPPPPPEAQQPTLDAEDIRKMSWVQQTAYKIAREQKKILNQQPTVNIADDVLEHINSDSHWLKAGKAGKLVAAVVRSETRTSSKPTPVDITLGGCSEETRTPPLFV